MRAIIGTAGWSIARTAAAAFPAEGTALERYACRFDGVEINSSFYRSHRPATWARWAASVPDHFRFAVKLPKAITHDARLIDSDALVAPFAREVAQLGEKLGLLLVQLPPKLAFDADVAARFFATLRRSIDVAIACEPRHASWFGEEADLLLAQARVARVAADPALDAAAAAPGGWPGLAYWRLHGSPVIYRSAYTDDAIELYARQIAARLTTGADVWCMFDNTAGSAATGNALTLAARLPAPPRMV